MKPNTTCFERHAHYILQILVELSVMLEINQHLQFAGNKTGRVLATVLSIVVIMLAIVVVCYCLRRRKWKPSGKLLLTGK
jgi:hypothetical protein